MSESDKIAKVNSEKSNVILGRISRDGDKSSIIEIEDITETDEVANAGDRCTDQDTPDQESNNPVIAENSQTESGCTPEVLAHSENFDQNQEHLDRSRNDTNYDAIDMDTDVDQITPEIMLTPDPEVDINRQITPEVVITPEPKVVVNCQITPESVTTPKVAKSASPEPGLHRVPLNPQILPSKEAEPLPSNKPTEPEGGLAEPGLHSRVPLTPQILLSKEEEPVLSNKPADFQHLHRPWEDHDYVNVSNSKKLVYESLQENEGADVDPLNISDKIIETDSETDRQKSEEIRGPSTSSPLSNMKSEPISPCLGLKSGSEDGIEIVEIFEKGKDSITDKDNPETAMNTTYEVIRTETEIVDDIEVFEISDNQDEDQQVQTIEVVQDKMAPKLKGTFLSEGTDVFVITPSKRTFFFPETENLNFSD